MGSTFLGLVLGIVIAAWLTTHYGDAWNRSVRGLVGVEAPSAATSADQPVHIPVAAGPVSQPTPGSMPALARAAEPASAAPATQIKSPLDGLAATALESVPAQARPAGEQTSVAPRPSEPPVAPAQPDVLERRWAEFAAQAETAEASGEFRWRHCFTRAAAAHGVAEPLLLAIASGESGFDPAARSDKDAIGVMQIRWPQTSRHLGVMREADLYDPCTNIAAGARYLAELSERFDHNLHRVVAAYNYGPTRIDNGALPAGARWYSQYIYQHLQTVLGRPHIATSELLPPGAQDGSGYLVLTRFHEPWRARDFKHFLAQQAPDLALALRSETLGQHEVVVLYADADERRRALDAIRSAGLLAATEFGEQSISL